MPVVRATAVELLSQMPNSSTASVLHDMLQSDQALLRQTAAQHLPLYTAADVEGLAPLLSDPVKAVRMASVSRLAAAPHELLKPYQQEAFDAALAEYRASMAYTLDFASSNFNLGNLEYALGDFAAAERYYRAALRIDDLATVRPDII